MRGEAFGRVTRVGVPPEVIGTPPDRTSAVTVVVPTFNHAHLIEDCLRGILNQRFEHGFRAIVYDDASTDGTQDILRRYVAQHPDRFQAVLERENRLSRGLTPAWFDTLENPVTPYVTFCEGDDEWIDEYKLERQWRFMQRNSWCALSHHEVDISAVPEATDYALALRRYLRMARPDHERVAGLALMDGNWIMTCSVMFRSSALPADLIAVVAPRHPQDFIIFALAAQHGDIGFLPECMARYRLHGTNFWSTMSMDVRASYELETLWFLAAHLSGAARDRIRERLLEALARQPDEISFTPFLRARDYSRGLEHDREVLLERVRYLEEREIELVRALGWGPEQS